MKWSGVGLKNATVNIQRAFPRIDNSKRVALGEPKNKKSRRTIRLTVRAQDALKAHRERQLEEMMK